MVGTVLKHRYEVLEKIGEGNLFTVYRCEDKIDNRVVAVKVLLPQYASNRMFAERILIEAQAIAGVSHPGMVEVYDSGEQDGTYYVITEYVRGVDLRERIRRTSPFSLSTAVDLGLAICEVLDYAHRRGFVHGDLRPGNVLVTPDGQVKIADFWVGNAIASAQSIRTSAMMRSVHYMSPEVAEGQAATPAGDIYSLGVILFEVLSGALPFDGDTPISIALKHSREPIPSLRALNPGIPKDLEALVTKALQKAPQDRHRSAKAMLGELRSVRDALHLVRPITWSQPADKTAPEPAVKPEDDPENLTTAEPVLLAAVRRTMLIVVLVIAVGVAVLLGSVMTRPDDVKVPDLIGKTLDEARLTATDSKSHIAVKAEQFNEEFPVGVIYFTNPPAGRMVKAGRTIDVWVSRGSKFADVPNVIKLPLEEATKQIRMAGLSISDVSQDYSDSIPAGTVMAQTPGPGTRQERSQSVKLVYSLGPKPSHSTTLSSDTYSSSSDETRTFDVTFMVPEGEEDRKVQIVVQDKYGETTAYTGQESPGTRVEQTVQGVGDKITIRIYIDDKLVREDFKWR